MPPSAIPSQENPIVPSDHPPLHTFHKYLVVRHHLNKIHDCAPLEHLAFSEAYDVNPEKITEDPLLTVIQYQGTCDIIYDPGYTHYNDHYRDEEGYFYDLTYASHNPPVIERLYNHPEKLPARMADRADLKECAAIIAQRYWEIMELVEASDIVI